MSPICEPQKPAMTAGLPISVPLSRSAPVNAGEVLAVGEDEVLVAGEHHVDAGDAGEEQRGVLHHVALLAVDAGMARAR